MPASFSFTKLLNAGLSATHDDPVRRTQMEDGYSKQQPKHSVAKRVYNLDYLLTSAQYTSFLTWHASTVSYGSAFFDFVDPHSASTVQGRLLNGQFNAKPISPIQNYWVVSMSVETYV